MALFLFGMFSPMWSIPQDRHDEHDGKCSQKGLPFDETKPTFSKSALLAFFFSNQDQLELKTLATSATTAVVILFD